MIVVRMNQDAVRGNKLFPAGLCSVGEDLSKTNLDIFGIYITIEPFQSRGQWLCKFIEQKKKGSTPTGLVCNTNMAFFLFPDSNRHHVNTLYIHHLLVSHNTPQALSFSSLGATVIPAKVMQFFCRGGGGEANKMYYGECTNAEHSMSKVQR